MEKQISGKQETHDRQKVEVLRIENLYVEYRSGGGIAKAVNGMNLTIYKGEAIGLVGESGAGKTTTALSILNLLPEGVGFITKGDIRFNHESIFKKSEKELNHIRGGQIGMVFANPLTSLNPVFTIGHQVAMVLMKHRGMKEKEANQVVKGLLEMVGISGTRLNDYPYQLSGGMRQRVGIIAALTCSPQLLILDEPTTALDVTIQAQILELIKKLQAEYSTSLLMITHNLGIISELCQRVAIMYGGEVVEYGSVREIFEKPKHAYTRGLLHAIPKLTGPRETLEALPGLVANAQNLPSGCKFHKRCSHCIEKCKTEIPSMLMISDDHYAACWRAEEEL
jgi:peptide/nickel transport system ATP-binding protein